MSLRHFPKASPAARRILAEIFDLAFNTEAADVFIWYSAHVNDVDIHLHDGGWVTNQDAHWRDSSSVGDLAALEALRNRLAARLENIPIEDIEARRLTEKFERTLNVFAGGAA